MPTEKPKGTKLITAANTGKLPPTGVRLVPELHSRVVQSARVAGRSMNAEISQRLHDSYLERPPISDADVDRIADRIIQKLQSSL